MSQRELSRPAIGAEAPSLRTADRNARAASADHGPRRDQDRSPAIGARDLHGPPLPGGRPGVLIGRMTDGTTNARAGVVGRDVDRLRADRRGELGLADRQRRERAPSRRQGWRDRRRRVRGLRGPRGCPGADRRWRRRLHVRRGVGGRSAVKTGRRRRAADRRERGVVCRAGGVLPLAAGASAGHLRERGLRWGRGPLRELLGSGPDARRMWRRACAGRRTTDRLGPRDRRRSPR